MEPLYERTGMVSPSYSSYAPLVLFLDDNEERIKTCLRSFPGARVVRTAAEMIALLREAHEQNKVIDYLFLDHDLGGEVFVDSKREDCGFEVVRWMLTNSVKVRRVVVHTHNGSAGQRMSKALREFFYAAAYIPFVKIPWGEIGSAHSGA